MAEILFDEQSDEDESSTTATEDDREHRSNAEDGWFSESHSAESISPRFFSSTSLFGFDPRDNQEFSDDASGDERP